ncbi:adhesion G-protein coupled receptor G6-like isoform X3 [Xiphophorus maculatus]|uniref:adhesion G-protein coupled receptor G6-like isoform X2 n=1 Tax=Xiphophorus maculatus TaxID=8083 RepID=UPI000C6CB7B1|nr:adhesion G-protein coupled receptor G6-like isoform X2 [Xiphophorus maculatus]XP_023203223.1 adhesion G-protein coupled receptor G6-like isoform X3 [Xiphophorus maculatus]
MPRQRWIIQVLLVGFLGIFPVSVTVLPGSQQLDKLKDCLSQGNTNYVVADNFYGIINAADHFTAKLSGKNGLIPDELPNVVEQILKQLNNTLTSNNGRIPDELLNVVEQILTKLNNILTSNNGRIPDELLNVVEQILTKLNNILTSNNGPIPDVLPNLKEILTKLNNILTSINILLLVRGQLSDGVKNILENDEQLFGLFKLYLNRSTGNSDLKSLVKTDILNWIINTSVSETGRKSCVIFLQKDQTRHKKLWKTWPQVKMPYFTLYITKNLAKVPVVIRAMEGKKCLNSTDCMYGNLTTNTVCKSGTAYNEDSCQNSDYADKYIINIHDNIPECVNCDNPIKEPDEIIKINNTIFESHDGEIDASKAVEFMGDMANLISKMNGTSAELSVAKGVEGVIVRKTDPAELDEVSFAYKTPTEKLKIIEDSKSLETFSRSVSVSKEAFEKAIGPNASLPFAAVLRFLNLTRDEMNSTVLYDEVVAIEMGTAIKNLTNTININFKNAEFGKFYPNCSSWNGEGGKPNWTSEGCETIVEGNNIRCQCSHLTFFAVLLTPINETISSSDLNILTIITQVGCGLSIFFLGIILFMYCLIRKTKASPSTQILIHLVCALFLLNLTFVVNHFVANLNSDVGCEIMAAVMHYSMLTTFSWFAAQGFHLCLQLYRGGNIAIKRYLLKVSVITWILPSIAVIIIASLKKYGKQIIYTDNPENNVAMCWINDNNIHYIVNVGYYAMVFLFTFTTVIITLSWLFCLKRSKAANQQETGTGRKIVIILGLCCQLGVTWGFAFFAYGSFRMIATYIFTILNSFQGFFLFIYYYKTTRVGPGGANAKGNSGSTNTSVSTLKTGLECVVNPYVSFDKQKDT